MSLNIGKCVILICSRITSLFSSSYSILGQPLQQVNEHPYLAIILDTKMPFAAYVYKPQGNKNVEFSKTEFT